jgi:hypothetical protein
MGRIPSPLPLVPGRAIRCSCLWQAAAPVPYALVLSEAEGLALAPLLPEATNDQFAT